MRLYTIQLTIFIALKLTYSFHINYDYDQRLFNLIGDALKGKRYSNIIYACNFEDFSHLIYDQPKIIMNQRISEQYSALIKADFYALSLQEIGVTDLFQIVMEKSITKNPRAPFLIVYHGNLDFLYKILDEYYIYNANIIHDGKLVVRNIDVVIKETLKVIAVGLQPYVICAECKTGVEIEFIESMLDFTLNYTQTSQTWGSKAPNGSYDGCLGQIQAGNYDFGIGLFHIREPENWLDFDVSENYMVDEVLFTIPSPLPLSHTLNAVYVFQVNTWIYFIATSIILSVIWAVLTQHWWHGLTTPMGFLLGELTPQQEPIRLNTRLLFVATWIFITVIDCMWEGSLIYHLTQQNYHRKFTRIDEAIESGLQLRIAKNLGKMYGRSGSKQGEYIASHNRPSQSGDIFEGVYRVAFMRDSIASSTTRSLGYLVPFQLMDENGRPLVYPLKEYIVKDYGVLMFRKGHPLFPRINAMLNWARAGGFIQYFDRKWINIAALTSNNKIRLAARFESRTIQLNHIEGIFMLYGLGCLFALLVFAVEMIWSACIAKKLSNI